VCCLRILGELYNLMFKKCYVGWWVKCWHLFSLSNLHHNGMNQTKINKSKVVPLHVMKENGLEMWFR
jgi:hypothetical protein